VVREGVGAGGRNDPGLVCNMNNNKKKKKKKKATAGEKHIIARMAPW
jgi:hypothetical protein